MKKKSFTLIELLVVIAIIGLLASIVFVYVYTSLEKARDTRRISDLKEIQKTLEMYCLEIGQYPDSESEVEGGWDIGNPGMDPGDTFIQPLVDEGMFSEVPVDPTDEFLSSHSYRYHRYDPDPSLEEPCKSRNFYILAVRLERSQDSYGIQDEVDPCYIKPFWLELSWYTLMGIE